MAARASARKEHLSSPPCPHRLCSSRPDTLQRKRLACMSSQIFWRPLFITYAVQPGMQRHELGSKHEDMCTMSASCTQH